MSLVKYHSNIGSISGALRNSKSNAFTAAVRSHTGTNAVDVSMFAYSAKVGLVL